MKVRVYDKKNKEFINIDTDDYEIKRTKTVQWECEKDICDGELLDQSDQE